MRILFVARHFTYFRNYDLALRELARRGHTIHLAVEKREAQGGQQAVEALAREHAGITFGDVPDRPDQEWADLARRLRLGLHYVRYLDAAYDDASLLRLRARDRTPSAVIRLAGLPVVGGRLWRRLVGRLVHDLDRAIPPPATLVDYLREQRPDVVLITPLVDLGSQQIDVLRAARRLGIPTALAVWSWDHLTSKAVLREYPERVLVWNETQRREAIDGHGVPGGRVVVTGAQCFDHWFNRQPSRTRDAFCHQLGLPADRPIVLWVCSALIQGGPLEPSFVRQWLQALRASSDPGVATAAVVIRPHPAQVRHWEGIDVSDLGPVAVWGGNPIDAQSRADYFDSLYHAAAVAGINTSAFIEAGIVGREVLAVLTPEFHDNHEGTLHFRYLLEIGNGLLRVSRDLGAHVLQVSAALARPASSEHPHRAFLEAFVRPAGLDQPATPRFVEAVEGLATCTVDRADQRPAPWWARRAVGAVRTWLSRPENERWRLSPRELEAAEQVHAYKMARRAARHAKREVDKGRWDGPQGRAMAEERAASAGARAVELARKRAAAPAHLTSRRGGQDQ